MRFTTPILENMRRMTSKLISRKPLEKTQDRYTARKLHIKATSEQSNYNVAERICQTAMGVTLGIQFAAQHLNLLFNEAKNYITGGLTHLNVPPRQLEWRM